MQAERLHSTNVEWHLSVSSHVIILLRLPAQCHTLVSSLARRPEDLFDGAGSARYHVSRPEPDTRGQLHRQAEAWNGKMGPFFFPPHFSRRFSTRGDVNYACMNVAA